eukprot:scaffold133276_cov90-Phaeocystis_antarctica.AAC.1
MARRPTRTSRRTNRLSLAKSTALAIGGGWLRVATTGLCLPAPCTRPSFPCLTVNCHCLLACAFLAERLLNAPPPALLSAVTPPATILAPHHFRAATFWVETATTIAIIRATMTAATPAATPAVPPAPPASTAPQARHSWPHAPSGRAAWNPAHARAPCRRTRTTGFRATTRHHTPTNGACCARRHGDARLQF